MTKQAPRLGRGLASLIGDLASDIPSAPGNLESASQPNREIPITSIIPNPTQPRSVIDDQRLRGLADSMRSTGVLQPVLVRPNGPNYELVAGERRWRAAQLAGLATIPAIVRQVTDQEMLELALIENLQREDLNPIDRSLAYRQCCERFGVTPDVLAQHLGEDRSTVTNYIRLQELPPAVHQMVRDGTLSMGHARSLLGLSDSAAIEHLARRVIDEGLSVRQTEEIVRGERLDRVKPAEARSRQSKPKRPLVQELEERFQQALQTRVTITEGRKKNSGRITIDYYTIDDFGRIAERLGVPLDEL